MYPPMKTHTHTHGEMKGEQVLMVPERHGALSRKCRGSHSLGVCSSVCLCEWGKEASVGSFADGDGVPGVQAGGGDDTFVCWAIIVCAGEPCSEPS